MSGQDEGLRALSDTEHDGPSDPPEFIALELGDLSEPELQVVRAAETGKLVDLTAGDPALDSDLGALWPEERMVRARVLSQLLMGVGKLGAAPSRAVRIRGARISGQFEVEGATLRCPLALSGCYFEEPIRLAEASALAIRVQGSRVPGLFAHQLTTRSDLQLTNCKVVGASVDLTGAHIGGQLDCRGAKLRNPGAIALTADGLQVDRGLFLREGFEAEGTVWLVGAHVGGQLDCRGAKLRNPPGAIALHADGLQVDQDLFLREGFEAEGEVRLVGAHVGGQLECSGGKLRNPGAIALAADAIQVDQDLFLREGFEAEGAVRLVRAHIGGQLGCVGGKLRNTSRLALDLENATVNGSLFLLPAEFDGGLDLSYARVGRFEDSPRTWPPAIRLVGFTYEALTPTVSVKQRLQWLHRNESGYSPQIYDQLAASYRRAGDEQDARRVAVAKQRRRRATLNIAGKLWGLVLDATVGYGYRTWQAWVWLLGLLALGTVIFTKWSSQLIPVKKPPEQPPFSAFLYTLDQLLPVLNLHQRDAWLPEGPLLYVALAFTVAGWVLTTAVVLSLTGLLKRTDAG